ncbi:MAG TPA: hypothetical protein VKD08_16980 [Ignavibacteriaceae bacterium]|nr:hypothetical protein [Ignavibacteriaceae bacterium]
MRYKKTFSIYLLIIFVLLQGISGLLGGISLIIDPSGGQIGLPVNWLEGSPFENFLIPGIILLTVLGVFPLITTMGLISGTRKALISSRLIGYALLIWIGVEIIIIGYRPDPPLQLIFGIEGVIILLLAYSTVVTNYYT